MLDDSAKKRSSNLIVESLLEEINSFEFKAAGTGKCNRRPNIHIQDYDYSKGRDCTVWLHLQATADGTWTVSFFGEQAR